MDQIVIPWILGSLFEDVLSEVVFTQTSQEVWFFLTKYCNKSSSSHLFELQRRLQTISKNDKSMIEYLKEIKSVAEQLASIGNLVSEKMKVFAALPGLGREYECFKCATPHGF